MTSSGKGYLDSNELQEDEELNFQDFGTGNGDPHDHLPSFTDFAHDGAVLSDEAETTNLLSEDKKQPSFWDFAYYKSFFNVDTTQVIQRIVWSMIPWPGRATYLLRHIKPNPDLYGPFWVSATLVFSIAISGNIALYLQTVGDRKDIWKYDFHKVSLAATTIYSYAFLLPLALWAFLWYSSSLGIYSLLDILCVYGYSLSIYIPISVLWVIRYSWFRWALVLVGALLSGSVLGLTFWPILTEMKKKLAVAVIILILLFHALLAVGFVTYFFKSPESSVPSVHTMLPDTASVHPAIKAATAATKIQAAKDSEKVSPLPKVTSAGSLPGADTKKLLPQGKQAETSSEKKGPDKVAQLLSMPVSSPKRIS